MGTGVEGLPVIVMLRAWEGATDSSHCRNGCLNRSLKAGEGWAGSGLLAEGTAGVHHALEHRGGEARSGPEREIKGLREPFLADQLGGCFINSNAKPECSKGETKQWGCEAVSGFKRDLGGRVDRIWWLIGYPGFSQQGFNHCLLRTLFVPLQKPDWFSFLSTFRPNVQQASLEGSILIHPQGPGCFCWWWALGSVFGVALGYSCFRKARTLKRAVNTWGFGS